MDTQTQLMLLTPLKHYLTLRIDYLKAALVGWFTHFKHNADSLHTFFMGMCF